jgi:hypothetical protein
MPPRKRVHPADHRVEWVVYDHCCNLWVAGLDSSAVADRQPNHAAVRRLDSLDWVHSCRFDRRN